MLLRAQKQLTLRNNELDTLIGVRTRKINRSLKSVTALPEEQVPFPQAVDKYAGAEPEGEPGP
ncbi:MAG: hypothetical protein V8Q85_00355 [Christensenellales bacterium]